MTRSEIERYRDQLRQMGRRLKGSVESLAGDALRRAGGEASGNLSNAPLHLADLGTDSFQQEVALSLLENDDQTLDEVDGALRRIAEGTYGRCTECGRQIGRGRLDAVPQTRYCIDCAREMQDDYRVE